jgi:ankyrin repeat protein
MFQADAHGNTPMHWAVKSGDVELMETLFKFGAHLDDQTSSESRMYPIHWAASEGKVTSIRFLLSNKCDINVQDSNGCTPLIVAAQHNMINAVIFLIKNGADFDVVDCNGDTALHWAAYKGYYELVAVLTYLFPSAVDRLDKFKQVIMSDNNVCIN